MTLQFRTATEADLPQLFFVDGAAFLIDYSATAMADAMTILDLDRFILGMDGEDVIGVAGDYPFTMTVPGRAANGAGATVDVPGVTWVSVRVTHRRQGVLRQLMNRQLSGLAGAGYPAAILTASEGGIYQRFGYGPATLSPRIVIDPRRARLVHEPGGSQQVRLTGPAEARKVVSEIHARWRAQVPGAISRSEAWWDLRLLDRAEDRDGMTGLLCLLHPDGYLAYRGRTDWNDGRPQHVCVITDFAAVTPGAHRALWQVVLGMDLYGVIESQELAIDDPLPHLLTDARQYRTVSLRDGLWLRPLAVAELLSARSYGVEVDAVIEVRDASGIGGLHDSAGRFRLRGGPDGADCRRTDAAADLVVDVDVLGSIYLGGHRLRSLAAAGRAQVQSGKNPDGMLTHLDRAFLAERAPIHGTTF